MRKLPATIVIVLMRIYQVALSPFLRQNCRFQPTCSRYAIEAVERHGVMRGIWLTARRLGRCHPWHEGGDDPVPQDKLRDRAEPTHIARDCVNQAEN